MGKKEVERCGCGAVSELKTRDESFFGGRVIIRGQEYYRCKRGHEYLTSEQMRKYENEFKNQYFVQRQVIETGHSLAITIPPDFAQFYHLKKGSKVRLINHGKKEAIIRFGN